MNLPFVSFLKVNVVSYDLALWKLDVGKTLFLLPLRSWTLLIIGAKTTANIIPCSLNSSGVLPCHDRVKLLSHFLDPDFSKSQDVYLKLFQFSATDGYLENAISFRNLSEKPNAIEQCRVAFNLVPLVV